MAATGTATALDGATIGIGTVGAGAWFSFDGGDRFRHVYRHLEPEGNVRAMTVSPHDPATVYAVCDRVGLFVSRDRGYLWEPVNKDVCTEDLWSLTVDPHDADTIYVGGRPTLYRSVDGGATFDALPTGLGPNCPIGTPRITNVVVDPADRDGLWLGVEVDGIYHSSDRGATFTHLPDPGETPFHGDIHGLALRRATGAERTQVLIGTPFGLGTSDDGGQSFAWRSFEGFPIGSGNPYAYCRGVFVWPNDPDTILVGCGDYIPGRIGAIEISRDGGASFERAALPVPPNSTVYWMATHPDLPGMIAAASVFGQVFVSADTERSWAKLDREFGEIRSVTLAPSA